VSSAEASSPPPALTRIAIAGASGRMGHMLIKAVLDAPDLQLCGALDRPQSPALGQDAATFLGRTSGVMVTDDVHQCLASAQVLIDFTQPLGTLAHLAVCQQHGVNAVIGTTGFDADQKAQIAEFAKQIAIVMAPNMSVGVNVLMELLKVASRLLDEDCDIEIIETHHRHKVDAPSGTALKMGEVIAHERGWHLADCAVYERHGLVGERPAHSIGFATVRGGDVVGDHTAMFASPGERLEITHRSSSRATYAQGSLRAARFLRDHAHRCGLFDMRDVLGIDALASAASKSLAKPQKSHKKDAI
jgi:4-hydroxy-tetrahydrodipicolinate reductase